jgi:hypothetical protein
LARLAIFVGAIQTGTMVFTTVLPQMGEFARIALGTDDYADFKIELSADRTALVIDGGIGFGLTDRLEAELQANPQVRFIELSSIGGRVQEARKLAGLIQTRALSTRVTRLCLSACTIAFMGGADRIVSTSGQFGFHRYSFPGAGSEDLMQQEAIDRGFLARRGVSQSFIRRIYETPATDMWRPTRGDLLDARVITSVVLTAREQDDFRQSLEKLPLYATIRQFEPNTYRIMLERGFDLMRRGNPMEFRKAVMPLVVPIYKRYMPHASDEAIRAAWNITIEQGKAIHSKDPEICFLYFQPGGTDGLQMSQYLPQETVEREFAAMAEIIRTGASSPRPAPTQAQIQADLERVFAAVSRRLGDRFDLAQVDPPITREQKAAHCDMVLTFLEEVAALPAARAPMVMRGASALQ